MPRQPQPSYQPQRRYDNSVPYRDRSGNYLGADAMTPLQRATSDSRVDARPHNQHQEMHSNGASSSVTAAAHGQRHEFLSLPAFPAQPQPFTRAPHLDQPPSYNHARRPASVDEYPSSYYNPGASTFNFPQPDLRRSVSQRVDGPEPHCSYYNPGASTFDFPQPDLRRSVSQLVDGPEPHRSSQVPQGTSLQRTTSYATSFQDLPPMPHVSNLTTYSMFFCEKCLFLLPELCGGVA